MLMLLKLDNNYVGKRYTILFTLNVFDILYNEKLLKNDLQILNIC